jgi:hypothetical protein
MITIMSIVIFTLFLFVQIFINHNYAGTDLLAKMYSDIKAVKQRLSFRKSIENDSTNMTVVIDRSNLEMLIRNLLKKDVESMQDEVRDFLIRYKVSLLTD